MKRIFLPLGLLVLVVAVPVVNSCDSLSAPGTSVETGYQQTGIWVAGTGEVTVTPDLAVLNMGVEVQKETVSEAYSLAAETMGGIIQTLKENNVSEEDIKTQRFSINQETDYRSTQPDVIIGYTVTNIAEVKIRDIDNASGILDAAVNAGGDYARIRSFGFTVDDPTIYYEEAREKALADALEKAEQIAENTDLTLGSPTFIAENTSYNPYSIEYPSGIMAPVVITDSGIYVSPGETTVTVTVQVAYSIS
jgi:uncharacterized protein YggE